MNVHHYILKPKGLTPENTVMGINEIMKVLQHHCLHLGNCSSHRNHVFPDDGRKVRCFILALSRKCFICQKKKQNEKFHFFFSYSQWRGTDGCLLVIFLLVEPLGVSGWLRKEQPHCCFFLTDDRKAICCWSGDQQMFKSLRTAKELLEVLQINALNGFIQQVSAFIFSLHHG